MSSRLPHHDPDRHDPLGHDPLGPDPQGHEPLGHDPHRSHLRALSRVASACLALTAFALAGCDDGAPRMDGGRPRDATVGDAFLLDSGPAYDATAADGGSVGDGSTIWTCDVSTCDPRSGVGCEPGLSCVLREDAPACVDDPGALAPGYDCMDNADCAAGAACFLLPGGGGRCERICCPGDPNACDTGARCGGSGRLIDGRDTSWGRCLPERQCRVLESGSDCESREGCYIIDSDGTTECRVAGMGVAGDRCMMQEDCQAGFFCGGLGGIRSCRRICDINRPACPIDEGRCVAQTYSPTGTGICMLETAAP
ncbi:MAG: hypothetical protein AB7S26_01955 [Sandaracinaceae bacterium]